MNNTEYWKEVKATAQYINEAAQSDFEGIGYDDAEEYINDTLLHETIDSHEYITYTANHLPILQHSDNADYMVDNLGGLEDVLKSGGLSGLHQALAYWAFYADVQEAL